MKKIVGVVIGLFLLLSSSFIAVAQDSGRWDTAYNEFTSRASSPRPDLRTKVASQLGDAMYHKVEDKAATLLVSHITNEIGRAGGNVNKETMVNYSVLEASVNSLKKITQPKAIEYLLKAAQDEKSNWRVRFYVIESLGCNTPEVISALIKLIRDPEPHIKMAAFDALSNLKVPDAIEYTCELLNENITWEVKIVAMNYLTKLIGQENQQEKEKEQEKQGDQKEQEEQKSEVKQKMIEPLINVIQNNGLEGCVRNEIVNLLKQLTGEDHGLDGRLWLDWLKKKKESEETAPKIRSSETISVIIPTLYYGITVTSTRVIFIIDISDSMDSAIKYDKGLYSQRDESKDPYDQIIADPNTKPATLELINKLKELKKKLDTRPVASRLDAARKELVNTIYCFGPTVEFAIILLSRVPVCWKDFMVPATIENKITALEFLRGTSSGAGTNMFDTLEFAYKFISKEQKTASAVERKPDSVVVTGDQKGTGGKDIKTQGGGITVEKTIHLVKDCSYINDLGGADNIFMVTDGSFSKVGKIIKPEEILTEIKKITQMRRVKINVVGIGGQPINPTALTSMDVDVKFAGGLADATGGIFKDKTTKSSKSK